jgi:hypothetical protein
MLRCCLGVLPFLYLAMPFTTLLEPQWLRESVMISVWMLKNAAAIFAFPCCTILITNSARSMRHLGTVNGITTSLGAVGRALGPTLVGAAFTWGVHHGMLLVPFWLNGLICASSWYAMFIAKEGTGFGEDGAEEELLDRQGEEEFADDESEGRERKRRRRRGDVKKLEEFAIASEDSEGEEEDDALLKPGRFPSARLGRTGERGRGERTRSATPIGTGGGFRRLSSNLGVTNSGWGSGSEL